MVREVLPLTCVPFSQVPFELPTSRRHHADASQKTWPPKRYHELPNDGPTLIRGVQFVWLKQKKLLCALTLAYLNLYGTCMGYNTIANSGDERSDSPHNELQMTAITPKEKAWYDCHGTSQRTRQTSACFSDTAGSFTCIWLIRVRPTLSTVAFPVRLKDVPSDGPEVQCNVMSSTSIGS